MMIGVLRLLRCHDSRTSMVNDIILGVLNNLFLAKLGFVSLGQYTVNSERHCYLPLLTQLIHSSIRHSKVLGAFSHYNKVQHSGYYDCRKTSKADAFMIIIARNKAWSQRSEMWKKIEKLQLLLSLVKHHPFPVYPHITLF